MAKNTVKKNDIRQYPVKRSINFAVVGVQKINMLLAIIGIVIIIILAFLFAKFAVVDVMTKAADASAEVSQLRSEVDAGYAKIQELKDESEEYAHYTYSGFSQEELTRADRIKVLALVEDVVLPASTLNSMTITGNVLTINLTAESLDAINKIAQNLEKETDLVSFCTVTTASTNTRNVNNKEVELESVTGQITVYLTDNTALTGEGGDE